MKLAAAVLLALLPLQLQARYLCGGARESRAIVSGQPYELDLRDVGEAVEVRIEESRSATFDTVTISSWTPGTPTPIFMHLSMNDQPLFYRITAYDQNNRNIDPCPTIQPVTIRADRQLRDAFRRSVIPIVQRTDGVVTSLSLFNSHYGSTLTGRIIFRQAGEPGRSDDPFIEYAVVHGGHVWFEDVLQQLHVKGLGSLDVVPDDHSPDWVPESEVRVRNVSESGASSGMTVPQVRVSDFAGKSVVTIHAPDEQQARTSIGVRSWSSGGSLVAHIEDRKQTRDIDLELPADTFRQFSLDELAGYHVATPATIFVKAKGAVVYGMDTDNVTNESRLRIAFGDLEGEKTFVGDFFQ